MYADAGFDVWLLNGRGTRYGRKHSTLDPDKDHFEFYEFGIEELGAIDLAEQLDYIVRETGVKQVTSYRIDIIYKTSLASEILWLSFETE